MFEPVWKLNETLRPGVLAGTRTVVRAWTAPGIVSRGESQRGLRRRLMPGPPGFWPGPFIPGFV